MDIELVNDLLKNLKENKLVQNFIKELSNDLEKNIENNQKNLDNSWNNLLVDNLEINNKKIISKFRNEMLVERANILQNYSQNKKNEGEILYIYNINSNEKDKYNLCNCNQDKSYEVITKKIEELPKDSNLGSIIIKQGEKLILDSEGTKIVTQKINNMIKEKIQEQDKYLDSKRIEGHIYEADEKYLGRILLYDLNNTEGGGREEIEEIEFPNNLYETAKKGDLFIYKNGTYQKYEN